MKQRIKRMVLSGLLAALVFLFTAYLHIPSHTGYTHVGDGLMYIAACLLPAPYAVFVGVCGALLADLLTGFAVWAPASLVIKASAVLFFSCRGKKILTPRNLLALLPACTLCVGGYYLYECLLVSNFIAPLSGIPGYLTQSVLSSLLFIILGFTLDNLDVRRHLL